MEYTDYDLSKLACEKLLGIDFSKRPYEGRIDPINDNSITFNLMVKYKVVPCYATNSCYIVDENAGEYDSGVIAEVRFNDESEIPKSIIMCILKSKNII